MGIHKGQKLTDNPKTERFEVRMTPGELEELNQCSRALDLNRSETLIKGLHLVSAELKNKN